MIYTDALDAEVDEESLPEDDPAQPEYVQKIEKELCWDCTDKIWALGEVRYSETVVNVLSLTVLVEIPFGPAR